VNNNQSYTEEDIIIDIPMKRGQLVRFQVMVYCQVNGYMTKKKPKDSIVSNADIDCLTVLGLVGQVDFIEFCNKIVEMGIFKTVGSTRNAVDRLKDKGLIVKEAIIGTGRKKLSLPHTMGIENMADVLTYRCYIS